MNASIIFGNPKMPCYGHGIFDLQPAAIPFAARQYPVTLSATGNDLIIAMAADVINRLKAEHPITYGHMQQGYFAFGLGALPFYIGDAVRSQLWGNDVNTDYACITPQSKATAVLNSDGSGSITISDIMQGNGLQASAPGMILPRYGMLSSGSWNVGADLYGNLCFCNGSCLIMFGAINGISFNGRTASIESLPYCDYLTKDVMYSIGGSLDSTQKIYSLGAWNIGIDQYGNLAFTNGQNYIVFHQVQDYFSICVHDYEAVYHVSKNALKVSADFGKNNLITTGKWTIAEDTSGNLCFYDDVKNCSADIGHFMPAAPFNVDNTGTTTAGLFISFTSYIEFE